MSCHGDKLSGGQVVGGQVVGGQVVGGQVVGGQVVGGQVVRGQVSIVPFQKDLLILIIYGTALVAWSSGSVSA
jgi:hypothetical protein